MPEYNTHTIC